MLRPRAALTKIQSNAISDIRRRQNLALWSKPGSGKTVIGLTATSDLFLDRTLIVGTKRICEHVWRQEAAQWAHLREHTFTLLFGSPRAREALLATPTDYHLINYELLPWLADVLHGQPWPYEAIIFDEISKMKTPGSRRVKKLRKPVQDIPFRLGLTGTPRGNSVLGLWSQFLMTNGPVLARTATEFKQRWFFPVDAGRHVWVPRPGAEKEIRELAAQYAYATPPAAASPEAKINVIPVGMNAHSWKLYNELLTELEIEVDGDSVTALDNGVMRGKLLQITSGAVYTDGEEFGVIHSDKLDALEELVEELQGDQLVVFFRFRHELARIKERFKNVAGINDLDAWLAGKHQIIAVHPASAAHGLNMHVGGCATAAWFTLPDSQELWEQGNRRLARKGQERQVVSHVLAIEGTIEDLVARQLSEHGLQQDNLISEARK